MIESCAYTCSGVLFSGDVESEPRCACGHFADFLCDFPLEGMGRACDAPLCGCCAVKPARTAGVDLCRTHDGAGWPWGLASDQALLPPPIDPDVPMLWRLATDAQGAKGAAVRAADSETREATATEGEGWAATIGSALMSGCRMRARGLLSATKGAP